MLNDRKASELISKSLAGHLSMDEADEMDQHLSASEECRSFARISQMIQESLSDIAVMTEDGDESLGPGLSDVAKQRLKDSIRQASRRIEPKPARTIDVLNPDSALALIAMEQQILDEDQLNQLVQSWKPTRPGTLGQYLHERGALTDSQLDELQERVDQRLLEAAEDDGHAAKLQDQLGESAALSQIAVLSQSAAPATDKGLPTADRGDIASSGGEHRQVVSRFTLIRKLGEGGLGSVWLARDEKIKRTVAIKEMSSSAAESPQAWQRFHREAEITGFLEHPNVVPMYQFGSDPKTGQPFYAMRFVGKRTLADAITEYHERRKADLDVNMDLRRLLTAFLGVCQAIGYAHSRGVIHRDLKPQNVALDNFGQVIVLDWGLAKLTDEGELAASLDILPHTDDDYLSRTRAGEIVGTPLYMSPEQASGDLANVDERTDVYGLGAILFSILTGYAPHERSFSSKDEPPPIAEVLNSIANNPAPSPRDYNTSVAADLEAICARAIAKNRFARFSSASELADEVERWMAGQTEKQQKYDNMRMEGREIRTLLQSSISDLSTNVRFMANLPPIQELIDIKAGVSTEDENTWRDRLALIYAGLLRANLDYTSVGFCAISENRCQEIVRVERHSTEAGNVRSVPLSRLLNCETTQFAENVLRQQPDEVHMSLVQPSQAESQPERPRTVRAGVPVFDQRSEEPFGYVWIECDLQKIINDELPQRLRVAEQIVFVDDQQKIWLHDSRADGIIETSYGRNASELWISMPAIVEHLQSHNECVCERDRQCYATRVDLVRRSVPLYFVLMLTPYEGN